MNTDVLVLSAAAPARPITPHGSSEPHSVGDPASAGWYAWGKPALDYSLALVLLLPAAVVVVLTAIAVKLTSAGPAFYTQTRVGRNGRRFTLLKLRTMRHRSEAASGPCWSRPGDDRVTPIGRFLRATHLDELPQLWNVFCGDMSLVGPRPERPEIIESMRLDCLVPGYADRLAVKPGVTGLAQLQLPPDTDIESVRRKVACDLCYIENCGPWLDLRILAGTLLALFGTPPRLVRIFLALPGAVKNAAVTPPSIPAAGVAGWRADLAGLCAPPPSHTEALPVADRARAELRAWFRLTAVPALYELAYELRRQGKQARVATSGAEEVGLRVWDERGKRELDLKFRVRLVGGEPRVYARELIRDGRWDFVHEHLLDASATNLGREKVIAFVLARYRWSVARTAR